MKRFVLFLCFCVPALVHANSFGSSMYRGWLWFEDQKQISNPILGPKRKLTREEMESIRDENNKFKEELDLLKHAMIKYPENLDYVKRYKEKEKKMLDASIKLSESFLMTDFLNPDISDQLENPQNLYGRTAKRELEQEENTKTLKSLAHKVELFLFFQDNCKYCEILERHLNRFASIYGFNVEAISNDGSKSSYFKTHHNKDLVSKLDLTVMPVVIAVTKDSKLRFELARGAVSVADLEENSLLMAKYLSKHNSQNNTNHD